MPLKGFGVSRPTGEVYESGGFIPFKKYDEMEKRRKELENDFKLIRSERKEAYEFGKSEAELTVLTMPTKRLFELLLKRVLFVFKRH